MSTHTHLKKHIRSLNYFINTQQEETPCIVTRVTYHFDSNNLHQAVHDSSLNTHSTATVAEPESMNQTSTSQNARLSTRLYRSGLSAFSL